MSLSEDCELQELVKQTLEKSGSLSKIRAELRASVFLALEENGCFQAMKTQNINLQNFSKTTDGVLLLCLIREFLEYFGLSFTASVFDPELASHGIYCNCTDRSKLKNQLNVTPNSSEEPDGPLLNQMLNVIRNIQNRTKLQKNNSDVIEEINNQQNCKSSDTSTEYLPLHTNVQEVTSNKKIEGESDENLPPRNDNVPDSKKVSDFKCNPISSKAANEDETITPKYNLTSLEDLPPLTSSFTSSKSISSGSINKSKQMNILKAALHDTIADDNEENATSALSDGNDRSFEDSVEFYEDIAEELSSTEENHESS